MPLEIPRSPVQHPHHRASGFSIPGRLPCLLAVVLGLFAHSEALAQSLDTLTIEGNGAAPAPGRRCRTDSSIRLRGASAAALTRPRADNDVSSLTVTRQLARRYDCVPR